MPKEPVKFFSTMGIIVDTECEDVKYIMEIDDNGVKMYELISRILHFKKENKVISVKQIKKPLEFLQSGDLTNLMYSMQGKLWKELLQFEDNSGVGLIREAFIKSKSILTTLTPDSFVYN